MDIRCASSVVLALLRFKKMDMNLLYSLKFININNRMFFLAVLRAGSVSYTHLDVYKRQSIGCTFVGADYAVFYTKEGTKTKHELYVAAECLTIMVFGGLQQPLRASANERC